MSERGIVFPTEERAIDAIRVGERRRRSLGDIEALAASIDTIGLLHPPLVTADGVLLCGARRLEAVRSLGWTTVEVRIHPGASTDLSAALAEQHENGQRLDLLPTEEARLFVELRDLYRADARHPTDTDAHAGAGPGSVVGEDSSPRWAVLRSRHKAALAITGKLSFQRLEQIATIIQLSEDPDAAWHVRRIAETALAAIDDGAPVDPHYRKVLAAQTLATLPTTDRVPAPPTPDQPPRASEDEVAAMSTAAEELARARRAAEIQAAAKRRLAGKPVQRSVKALIACVQSGRGAVGAGGTGRSGRSVLMECLTTTNSPTTRRALCPFVSADPSAPGFLRGPSPQAVSRPYPVSAQVLLERCGDEGLEHVEDRVDGLHVNLARGDALAEVQPALPGAVGPTGSDSDTCDVANTGHHLNECLGRRLAGELQCELNEASTAERTRQ